MAIRLKPLGTLLSVFAVLSLTATPVQAAELPEVVVETHFDAPTIVKGYTLESHDARMRLGIRPKTLNVPTRVDIKTLDKSIMQDSLTSFADGVQKELVGDIYLFDILNKSSYDGTDFFFLEIKYPEGDVGADHGRRRIHFYNKVTGMWHELPSADAPEYHSVRALIHLPYARLAIFEEPQEEVSYMQSGKASWYRYRGCNCAASPDFPKGTLLRVTLTGDPSKSVVVRVNDYGPVRSLHPDRVIDLDAVAYQQLAPLSTGLVHVRVEPVE